MTMDTDVLAPTLIRWTLEIVSHSSRVAGRIRNARVHRSVASTVPAAAKCMIDEGNGRVTPCEVLFKSKKCMIDEGNGRYTPCEALFRQKKTKKKT